MVLCSLQHKGLKDVKSTTSSKQITEIRAMMCQLYNVELSKHVMVLTSTFCRDKKEHGNH